MMEYPVTKIVRIKNAHFNEFGPHTGYNDLVKSLLSKGFIKVETTNDRFIETFEHPEYGIEGKNTIASINLNDLVSEVKYTITSLNL